MKRDQLEAIRERVNRAASAKAIMESLLGVSHDGLFEIVDDAADLIAYVSLLRGLVAKLHRDQRGDNRCAYDDDDLYAAVFPEDPLPDTSLPPREEFLESCARHCSQFWEQRQRPGEHGTFPHPKTIKQLEDENAELREEINQLNSVIRGL